jgi:hypothetical protein
VNSGIADNHSPFYLFASQMQRFNKLQTQLFLKLF